MKARRSAVPKADMASTGPPNRHGVGLRAAALLAAALLAAAELLMPFPEFHLDCDGALRRHVGSGSGPAATSTSERVSSNGDCLACALLGTSVLLAVPLPVPAPSGRVTVTSELVSVLVASPLCAPHHSRAPPAA
jgi:hypothetical protein